MQRTLAALSLALALGCASRPATQPTLPDARIYTHTRYFASEQYVFSIAMTRRPTAEGFDEVVDALYVARGADDPAMLQAYAAPFPVILRRSVKSARYGSGVSTILFSRLPTQAEARGMPAGIPFGTSDHGPLGCIAPLDDAPRDSVLPWTRELPRCSSVAYERAQRAIARAAEDRVEGLDEYTPAN